MEINFLICGKEKLKIVFSLASSNSRGSNIFLLFKRVEINNSFESFLEKIFFFQLKDFN